MLIKQLAHTYNFFFSQLRGSRNKDIPVTMRIPSAQMSNEKNYRFLEKWLIPGLGKETYDLSLEHLVEPENRNSS